MPMTSSTICNRQSMADNFVDLKKFLDQKTDEFNRPEFIQDDPISIPHLFTKNQDIEISGFFAAIFAWGIRKTIINKCKRLMELMDYAPHDFCVNHADKDLKRFLNFSHRTFNATDLLYFIRFLKHHYQNHSSLESAFFPNIVLKDDQKIEAGLNSFYEYFFSLPDLPHRTRKHIAAPFKNSACKRLNMFLRWMVRNDGRGVDFGIWHKADPSGLICPLDLHVARVARKFGLIERKQTDWQAAVDLTKNLKVLDKCDPVKYDFALFGLGILEKY